MVHATQACQAAFNVRTDVKTCVAERNGSCLSPAQKDVIASTFAGGKTTSGRPIYVNFPYDPGVAGSNWAMWKFVNSFTRDPLAIGSVFSVPPGPVDPLKDDVSARLAMFDAVNEMYRESGFSLMAPPGEENPANLASLRARGAKIILYHGVSDPIFSAEDTRQWMERLGQAGVNPANDFARYFPVPGMSHCSGGPATDQVDLLTPLVQWVERGIAPQAVVASVRGAGNAGGVNAELTKDWSPSRTRPLCAYPQYAHYKGSGNTEDAANFSCR
jgi:feruloyl esterase